MKREDDQQLWDLLGKTAEPRVSPFFARNVVRAIRTQPAGRSWLSWVTVPRLAALASCAAAIVIAAVLAQGPITRSTPTDEQPSTVAQFDPDDADIAADLDDLVGPDDDADGAIR